MAAGCRGNKEHASESEGFIMVDVTKKYPTKELILQDFMDVDYIVLDTNDDFFNQGVVLAIGKDEILVKNQINDGDLFIYDRNGKGLRKINRKGQGGEEYTSLSFILLDAENNEMFVNSYNRILVYDLFGKFKRSFPNQRFGSIRNFDKDNLICSNGAFDDEKIPGDSPFVIISKQDGIITKEISIISQIEIPKTTTINHNGFVMVGYSSIFPSVSVIPFHNSWFLTAYSSDTVFQYLPDYSMIPFMVRTPTIESKSPESFLTPVLLTDPYYFLQTVKIEPEAKGSTPQDAFLFYQRTNLLYDRQEMKIFEYTVFNDDYTSKVTVEMTQTNGNDEVAFWQKIESHQLIEAYEKGELKDGKLKEIAAKLDAEDNPVIMLIKHKR